MTNPGYQIGSPSRVGGLHGPAASPHLAARGRALNFEPATGLFNLPHSHSAFEAGTLRLTADLRRTGLSMVTIHRWTQAMRCPHCENEGTTALAQPEVSFDVTVESISKGFEAVQSQYGVNYRCVPCGILVRK